MTCWGRNHLLYLWWWGGAWLVDSIQF